MLVVLACYYNIARDIINWISSYDATTKVLATTTRSIKRNRKKRPEARRNKKGQEGVKLFSATRAPTVLNGM